MIFMGKYIVARQHRQTEMTLLLSPQDLFIVLRLSRTVQLSDGEQVNQARQVGQIVASQHHRREMTMLL